MEPKLSGFFWVKMVAKNIVPGSPGTHFMHMMVKVEFLKKSFFLPSKLSIFQESTFKLKYNEPKYLGNFSEKNKAMFQTFVATLFLDLYQHRK